MLAREGAQMGSLECALVKLTPLDAMRSMFGVARGRTAMGREGRLFRSSMIMKSTLGASFAKRAKDMKKMMLKIIFILNRFPVLCVR